MGEVFNPSYSSSLILYLVYNKKGRHWQISALLYNIQYILKNIFKMNCFLMVE